MFLCLSFYQTSPLPWHFTFVLHHSDALLENLTTEIFEPNTWYHVYCHVTKRPCDQYTLHSFSFITATLYWQGRQFKSWNLILGSWFRNYYNVFMICFLPISASYTCMYTCIYIGSNIVLFVRENDTNTYVERTNWWTKLKSDWIKCIRWPFRSKWRHQWCYK